MFRAMTSEDVTRKGPNVSKFCPCRSHPQAGLSDGRLSRVAPRQPPAQSAGGGESQSRSQTPMTFDCGRSLSMVSGGLQWFAKIVSAEFEVPWLWSTSCPVRSQGRFLEIGCQPLTTWDGGLNCGRSDCLEVYATGDPFLMNPLVCSPWHLLREELSVWQVGVADLDGCLLLHSPTS